MKKVLTHSISKSSEATDDDLQARDTAAEVTSQRSLPPEQMDVQPSPDQALGNMRNTAYVLSEMLEHAVCEVRRLQKRDEAMLGRSFENREELNKSYDTKSMKELTAILKDVVAVEKALCESGAEQEAAASTGVVLLPPVAEVETAATALQQEAQV